jgi:hypothetical protein
MEAPTEIRILHELEHLPDAYADDVLTYVQRLSQKADERQTKLQSMREAAQDPLYLADLRKVEQDFAAIDHETL